MTLFHERARLCDACEGKGGSDVTKCKQCKGEGVIMKRQQVGMGMYAQS